MPGFSRRERYCPGNRVHDRRVLSGVMGKDLTPEDEKSPRMGFPAFMKMEGGDCKGIISFRAEFAARETGEIHPDLEHQHVEMEQFIFLHPITFRYRVPGGCRVSRAPGRGYHTD